jgi:hypothetical protein
LISVGVNGLGRKSKVPARVASTAVVTDAYAVIITVSTGGSKLRASRKTSKPPMPGNFKSSSKMSGGACRNRSTASSPLAAPSTS